MRVSDRLIVDNGDVCCILSFRNFRLGGKSFLNFMKIETDFPHIRKGSRLSIPEHELSTSMAVLLRAQQCRETVWGSNHSVMTFIWYHRYFPIRFVKVTAHTRSHSWALVVVFSEFVNTPNSSTTPCATIIARSSKSFLSSYWLGNLIVWAEGKKTSVAPSKDLLLILTLFFYPILNSLTVFKRQIICPPNFSV